MIVERADQVYELTGAGTELGRALHPLWAWAADNFDQDPEVVDER